MNAGQSETGSPALAPYGRLFLTSRARFDEDLVTPDATMKTLAIASISVAVAGLAVLGLLLAEDSSAQTPTTSFRVIVHPGTGVSALTRAEVSDLLLKKQTRWADGSAVKPVDLSSGSATREAFSLAVHGRTVDRVKNYWQRRIFSGRDVPPPELDTSQAVADFVRDNAGSIGYVGDDVDVSGARVVSLSD